MNYERLKPNEVEELRRHAAADDHGILGATHLVRKNGEIVGFFGVGGVPVVTLWLHREKVHAVESLKTFGFIDNYLRCLGVSEFIAPCSPDSPFFKEMERLGYKRIMDGALFRKEL